jgi:predicted phosphohydrolase
MARFLLWSDLHDEFWQSLPETTRSGAFDAILLAGDISTRGRHVDCALLIWDRYRVPVIMVRGNHEFYRSEISELIAEEGRRVAEMNAAGADIRILDGAATEVAGVRVIGATLWTDLDLYPGEHRRIRDVLERGMKDFQMIRSNPVRQFAVADWLEMHWRDRDAIFALLDAPFDGETLVMTHHAPVRELVHPARMIGSIERQLITAGFASDLWWEIRNRNVHSWVSGHTHDNADKVLQGKYGPVRFVANARGYPKEGVEFDPDLVIEVLPRPEPSMDI